MPKLCVTACICVLICLSGGPKRDGKEGEVEEMIDARVRLEPGVDIYGPCSAWGGLPQARRQPQGPIGFLFWL